MQSKSAYKFIEKLSKLAKLTPEMFSCCYEELVRYFSLDQLFFKDKLLYKATGINSSTLYTGNFQMLTQASVRSFRDGTPNGYSSGGEIETPFALANKRKFDYKELTKACLKILNS